MSDFSEFGSREKDGWSNSRIVEAYINRFVPITDFVGDEIVEKYISADDRVLDLCCGQGTLTSKISSTGAKATGLDFSPEMTSKARIAAPDAVIVEGSATAMPFGDGEFEKIVCNFGMMHIEDQPKALSEIRRVLKPGGRFVMATWDIPANSPGFGAVFGPLKALADFSAAPPQPDLFAFADPVQASEMMASEGLLMDEHKTVEARWILEKPTELFEIFLTATVGAGMLIRSQSDETVAAIADSVAKNVSEKFGDGSGFRVPVSVVVISANAN